MITHVRTPLRCVPTAMIVDFGVHPVHRNEIFITDTVGEMYPGLKGQDCVKMKSRLSAEAAIVELRHLTQLARARGPYIRLCPPGVPRGNDKWMLFVIEHGQRVAKGFRERNEGWKIFEALCADFACLAITTHNTLVVH